MTWFHPHAVTRRADAGRLVVSLLFIVLAVTFFRIQVLGAYHYELESKSNRLRPVPVPAPRGLILDRNGVVLAENVPGYTIALMASDADSLRRVLEQVIAPIANLDSLRIANIIRRFRRAPHEPTIIRRDASFELVSALEESRVRIKRLVIEPQPKRSYPHGSAVAHVLGYVGEITEEELATDQFRGARGGTIVGRDGLERQYDATLRGRDGQRFIEVDALGRTVKHVQEDTIPAEQGDTLHTTLDIELQTFVEEAFPDGWRGAVVAMDPRTGGILALYSSPSYDPNLFVGGMDPEIWRSLSRAADNPLFNRAIEGRYAPASPFKLAVAASALRRGIVDFDSRMDVPCEGGMLYGNRYFRCWREEGHGELTLHEAILHSCDVYFYQLGLRITLADLLSDGAAMGFLDPAGIDLPDERTPIFPPSVAYYDERYGPRGWTSGVTLNLAIGQGEHSQTVINVVKFFAKLANPHGAAPEPRLVLDDASAEESSLGLTAEQLAGLREALVMVVEEGTAVGARLSELRIAGKTGTAQNPHGLPHGWFVGFAPAENPEIVVGAVVEFAEHGSSVAYLVTNIIQRHFFGPEVQPSPVIDYLLPSDSAPQPIRILPDSSLTSRTPAEVGVGGAAQPR
ncbi:MAG: penicillin-binding protein 2 [Gemmatimonadota bacterium]|nr:MAG: penicillin-binding protein 2 [Gemmatimonadota bacterium]